MEREKVVETKETTVEKHVVHEEAPEPPPEHGHTTTITTTHTEG
jgi:hypothetical protein